MKRFSSREILFIGAATVALCATVLTVLWRAQTIAHRRADDILAAHAAALEQVRRITLLQARQELIDDHPQPEPDLVAHLEAALESAGIASKALRQVSVSEPAPLPATLYARQRAQVTLDEISAPDGARFLAAWNDAQPLWTPRSVILEYKATRASQGPGSTDERFTLRITLENIHLAQTTSQR